ncbi:hypothetical protein EG328_006464 [Venturia inaequalis]|uniref:J domain-containing protein n=1 Tax=Venturia inaequalis TaxID=5025 RepID=A0A8H3VMF2_VENIN|nr:hypothetical protein EG328_006464 [Venturia inaequalis]KAE9992972.1 hypothetical protein EG327_007107 [Venturia inaequalis]RDI82506.1 hypothetical protein Vi05172_g7317 [Venturia inaequalis]
MSTPMTPDRAYSALGLNENTPRKEIRKAYFRLALKHHPDKVKDEQAKKLASEQFRDIQSAYETLTHDRRADRPSLDALKRRQARSSHAWTGFVGRSKRKTDYQAYGEEDEDEETDDVGYGEEAEEDVEDGDRRCRSDAEESEDGEEAVWPTSEMRTTGYTDPNYNEKGTIFFDAPKKLVIGDGGIKDVAFTAEKEEWEDFRNTVDQTPFVFEPPPLRKPIYKHDSALSSNQATRPNKPPIESSRIQSEALTSRIMPRGLPRVIGMTKQGHPIHEGEDMNNNDDDDVKRGGNYLTAAQYNRFTRPQTAGLTIANAVAWREAPVTEIKVLACQECFPGMGQWTVEEAVCGNCRGGLERIGGEVGEEGREVDISGMFLGGGEVENEDVVEGEMVGITFEDAAAALSREGVRSKIVDSATAEAMDLE